jgi:alpha-1,3-rhamnosyltransferase
MKNEIKPLVSMLIPCYNHEYFVRECIESVILQDYKNIELLIIDDGSSDDSIQTINELQQRCQDRFVRFEFRARANQGLSATINEALQWSEGKYFAAIASDDRLHENKTSFLIERIEQEIEVAGIFSGCQLINASGQVIGHVPGTQKYYNLDDVIMHRHSIHAATQLLKKDVLLEVGCYAENVYTEDWYMWLKITEAGYKLKTISEELVDYRKHATNSSKRLLSMHESKLIVLSHFKQHALYRKAVANIYIWTAINFSSVSKKSSLMYLVQALKVDWMSVFRPFFIKAVLRSIKSNHD